MSLKACGGSLVLLCGLLLAGASAEPAPAPSGAWVDPPVRGATGPQEPAPVRPEPATDAARPGGRSSDGANGNGTKGEKPVVAKAAPAARPPSAPVRAAASSRKAVPAEVTRPARALVLRRYPVPIRRLAIARAAGVHRVAEAPAVPRRLRARERVAMAPLRMSPRRHQARMVERSPRYEMAEPYESVEPPMYARRAGWGGLVSREDRVAEAYAAGYRVMRLRTYAYPDGRQIQQLMPVGPDAFY